LPTWTEAKRTQGLLRSGLNPRAKTLVDSNPDPKFKKLVIDVLDEFRKLTGYNVQKAS
jgi:hypothetical protein